VKGWSQAASAVSSAGPGEHVCCSATSASKQNNQLTTREWPHGCWLGASHTPIPQQQPLAARCWLLGQLTAARPQGRDWLLDLLAG